MFKPIRPEHFAEDLGTAIRYSGHRNFQAYVLFWPDKKNRFVWQSEDLSLQVEAADIVDT
jgi:hypothetical protein